MPQPTAGDVHVNVPLTNVLVAYIQADSNFIAGRAFPEVPVQKQSDLYWQYPKGEWFREEAQERAPGTESTGSGYDVDSSPNYFARVYAFHKDIPDQIRSNADSPINMDRDASRLVGLRLLIKRERLWVGKFFKTGVWSRNLKGLAAAPDPTAGEFLQWDNADSDPVTLVTNESIRMAEFTGYRPNKMIVAPYVFNALRNHPMILDRIRYTQKGVVTADLLASLFEVDQFLVPFATSDTAKEKAAAAMAFMYGRHALLMYTPGAPSIMEPSAGYTFTWTGYLGAEAGGSRITTFRMEALKSDRVEGEMAFDQKLVAEDCATFFEDCVADTTSEA